MKELNGISPKTLADTLKKLQDEALIKREAFAEIPPRVEYSLSREGEELRQAILPLLKWAATREHNNKKCAASSKDRCLNAHKIAIQESEKACQKD